MTRWMLVLVLAISLTLAACGGDSGDDSSGAAEQPSRESSAADTAAQTQQQSQESTSAEAAPTATQAGASAPSGGRISVQAYLDICSTDVSLGGGISTYQDLEILSQIQLDDYAVDPPEELVEWNDLTLERFSSYREYFSGFPSGDPLPSEWWNDPEFTALDMDFAAKLDEALENIADVSLRADLVAYGCHPYYEGEEYQAPDSEIAGINRAELEDYLRLCGETEVDIDIEDEGTTYGDFSEAIRDRLREFEDATPPDVLRDFHRLSIEPLENLLYWVEDQPGDEVIDQDALIAYLASASTAELQEEQERILGELPEELLEVLYEANCL